MDTDIKQTLIMAIAVVLCFTSFVGGCTLYLKAGKDADIALFAACAKSNKSIALASGNNYQCI